MVADYPVEVAEDPSPAGVSFRENGAGPRHIPGGFYSGFSLKILDKGFCLRSLPNPRLRDKSQALSSLIMLHAFSLFVAQAAPAGAQPPSAAGMFVPMICIFVIMYFLMIRPQQQKQKQLQQMIDNVKTGDEVIVAGIHGVVANLKDGNTLTLKIADNVRIEVEKSAIVSVAKKVDLEKV